MSPSSAGSAKFYDSDFFDPKRKWAVLLNAQHGLTITTEPGHVAKLMDRFFVRYKTEEPRIGRLGARGPVVLVWRLTESEAGLLIEYLKPLTSAVTVRRFYNACMREFHGRREDEATGDGRRRRRGPRKLHGLSGLGFPCPCW